MDNHNQSRTHPDGKQDASPCPATQRQLDFLARHHLVPEPNLTRREAWRMIGDFIDRQRDLDPTPNQILFLRSRRLWRPNLTRGEACDLIKKVHERESGNG